MRAAVKIGLGTIAGAVGAGLLAFPAASAADADQAFWKRDDDRADVVMTMDDDDDDDTGKTNGDQTQSKYTQSKASNDNTNSVNSAVSKDRDHSQGDRTRDWTRDGGDKTRDHTANQTNDKSRNDTRF